VTTSFIEKQFPVSKVSKESYKERKSSQGQTITGLGKWWGRKPLVLVRAAILGCLMPASDNPRRDMEVFLKIMSMDETGLWLRKSVKFSLSELYEFAAKSPRFNRRLSEFFTLDDGKLRIADGADRDVLERAYFDTFGYDKKISMCVRPEQLPALADQTWNEINEHLKTNAHSLQELVNQLSQKRFGHNVTVGDCFCGGGSIPFEAARMGCNTYASDLNPVAGLLTWAGINICGASEEELEKIREFQQQVYEKVDREITELGIEHNEKGDRALSYIYCVESVCPECGAVVPLIPSLVVGKRAGSVVAKLHQNGNRFDIEIKSNATDMEMKEAANGGTVVSGGMYCPACGKSTPISALRRDRTDENGNTVYGLRRWEKGEFEPRSADVFQERLYAVRYEHTEIYPNGKTKTTRYYCAPSERDIENEKTVHGIVAENIELWQEQGLVPSMEIEDGDKTNEVIRNRGWTHWNHLFNARQLYVLSRFIELVTKEPTQMLKVVGILGINKCADFGSDLCRWNPNCDKTEQTFYNQAFNTMMNWGVRSLTMLSTLWFRISEPYQMKRDGCVILSDAKDVKCGCDYWITDPPYADAINYHELSEFFLAWDKRLLQEAFPEWYTDSKRILAVKGDEHFSQSMIEIYSNLAAHMPEDGMQIVMFTHSDPAVWAQLALIMWKAGLKVTAAWNIATETDASGLKDGNYVKGTVLLVLRKQVGDDEAFLDELNSDIKAEVKNQIESMQALDDKEDPNFADPDYVLAAYAASLKVLTSYKSIGEIDLDYELNLAIHEPARSKVVALIERAKKIAYDCIIPLGFDSYLWKDLSPSERFYIKGLESEKNGNYQISTYQEYARGFAISSYSQMMANEKANTARLKTPTEFAMRTISDVPDFERSTLRLVLAAIHVAIKEDETPEKGLWHIKNNLADYWGSRDMLRQLLAFLRDCDGIENMPHWQDCARMAEHIYVLVDNDHI
jgi:adenine-specific DNA methylase